MVVARVCCLRIGAVLWELYFLGGFQWLVLIERNGEGYTEEFYFLLMLLSFFFFFFFFQAEDGIRDGTVTGVQTCALPIYIVHSTPLVARRQKPIGDHPSCNDQRVPTRNRVPIRDRERERVRRNPLRLGRSEERRVGKECRSRWSPDHGKQKNKT